MSKLYTIERYESYSGIEIRQQTMHQKGNDSCVLLSSIYTGKDEQIIYLKDKDFFQKSFRINGRKHIDLILEADIGLTPSFPKHKVLIASNSNKGIIVLIKYKLFQIENVNAEKEKDRQKLVALSENRDYNLLELFPGESLIVWNKGSSKIQFTFDEIISSH